ncbi:uncharacterized protein LOC131855562 [Achroia grisella]|uniref:uncharacterized protein LOC131855562 n=1 Tax=Achroia grisella TaxID=688607 RepID=UPI0027D227D1|nr:uncharacterized protein LOC131855562 [Achroia grisella]
MDQSYPSEYIRPFLICFDMFDRINIRFFDSSSFFWRNWRFVYIIPCILVQCTTMSIYMTRLYVEDRNMFVEARVLDIPFTPSIRRCSPQVDLAPMRIATLSSISVAVLPSSRSAVVSYSPSGPSRMTGKTFSKPRGRKGFDWFAWLTCGTCDGTVVEKTAGCNLGPWISSKVTVGVFPGRLVQRDDAGTEVVASAVCATILADDADTFVIAVVEAGILKGIVLLQNITNIRVFIDEMARIWRIHDLNEEQVAKKNRLYKKLDIAAIVFFKLAIATTWLMLLFPLVETVFRKLILGQNTKLILAFASTYPFDPTTNWFIYIVVYFFQVYSMLRMTYIYLNGNYLLITLCGFLGTQIAILLDDFDKINPINKNGNTVRGQDDTEINISEFIMKHQTLIRLTKQLNGIFNKFLFIKLLFDSMMICFFGLAAKSGDLADAVYRSMWYKGDAQYMKMILFIILRSQKPLCLTSLKYRPVTLNTFSKVLSTTWSYFSLVNTMYEHRN